LRALPPGRTFSPSPAGVAGWRSTGKPPSELPFRPKWERRSRVGASGRPAHRVGRRLPGGSPLRPGWMPERPRCHATSVARRRLRAGWLLTTPNDRKLDHPCDSFAECLSSGSPAARPLPGVAPLRNCGSTRNSRSVLVVPAHLDGFLRAADAGVLQPAPDEVRRVSVGGSVPTRSVSRSSRGSSLPLPRDASAPLEEPAPRALTRSSGTPDEAAASRLRDRCPPAVFTTSRLYSAPWACIRRGAVAGDTVEMLVLPWVLFPSEALAAHRSPTGPFRGAPGHPTACAASVRWERFPVVADRWPP